MSISLIVPVYNRPEEIDELLASCLEQTDPDFQLVIVEDGSERDCEAVCDRYADRLRIKYYAKENSGPGLTRNYGFERSTGSYGVFLDSDVLLPEHYIEAIKRETAKHQYDVFGGPDRAHPSFSPLQKAINYAMTSFFTTGGIRGGTETHDSADGRTKAKSFHPRSFNMGITREVFERTGGFRAMRFGEDIDLSIRIRESGFSSGLIRGAFVYHKRRTSFKQFFKQVHNSGIARINLHLLHPGTLKVVHVLPAVFVVGVVVSLLLALFWSPAWLIPLGGWAGAIFIDAILEEGSLYVAVLAVVASVVQLWGYGTGFLIAAWRRLIRGQGERAAFLDTFYE